MVPLYTNEFLPNRGTIIYLISYRYFTNYDEDNELLNDHYFNVYDNCHTFSSNCSFGYDLFLVREDSQVIYDNDLKIENTRELH